MTKRKKDSNFYVFFVIIVIIAWVFALVAISHASDYTITYYGQGVFSVEHGGVIHIQGQGEPSKDEGTDNIYIETDLEAAQRNEAKGEWYYALRYYEDAGDLDKMKEMAYKEIEQDIAKGDYLSASNTATQYLKDKELAMEYYDKYLTQELNE